jgi:plasmid stabilization system protein ParE
MAEINWTAEAQQWLREIYDYIAQENPQAARRIVDAIGERV